ncbi:MAG: TetR/AcrR family transcriptional regulator [Ignavibacteriales bacterium]|nr:TetR/AcrR family transcriptional regulator [Ignavibacteriales bacterium]MCF8316423.1 TetR/AcrR family transcriptional regulator [Ignavibacteriales bacterium]MCF8437903.1 TetR/AcrR family transcriptional regulator [Ignavibacteriales bacterium]
MGITERREREKEQRRSDIIRAAEKVFFARGFETATMDDLAAEAELSKGTLYLYFKSKDEVYLAIVLKAMKLLREYFENAVTHKSSGLEKVRAIGESYIQFHEDYPDHYKALLFFSTLQMDETSGPGAELKAFVENKDVMEVLYSAIIEGIKDESIRSDIDPLKTALILWGQTSGVLQLMTLKGHAIGSHFKEDPKELLNYFLDLMTRALSKTEEKFLL